jgi:hypothetical protein
MFSNRIRYAFFLAIVREMRRRLNVPHPKPNRLAAYALNSAAETLPPAAEEIIAARTAAYRAARRKRGHEDSRPLRDHAALALARLGVAGRGRKRVRPPDAPATAEEFESAVYDLDRIEQALRRLGRK